MVGSRSDNPIELDDGIYGNNGCFVVVGSSVVDDDPVSSSALGLEERRVGTPQQRFEVFEGIAVDDPEACGVAGEA